MSFQENLKYYREKSGYKTAKDFADVLNIPYTSYVAYENKGREPKYEMLCKIADLLEVSTDDLLGRTTNILGNNEDNNLQKDLDDVLLSIDYLYIKLNSIDEYQVLFDIGLYDKKRIKILDTISINKKDIIQYVNKSNIEANKFKHIMIERFLIDRLVKTATILFNDKLEQARKEYSEVKKQLNKNDKKNLNALEKKLTYLALDWIDKKNNYDLLWEIYQKNKGVLRIEPKLQNDKDNK